MAVALWLQSKVCDAIFLKVCGFRSISGLEKGKQEGDGLFESIRQKYFKRYFRVR